MNMWKIFLIMVAKLWKQFQFNFLREQTKHFYLLFVSIMQTKAKQYDDYALLNRSK